MSNIGKSIQTSISFAIYILSSFFIISPLHKSENLPLSLLCALATSFCIIYAQFNIFSNLIATKSSRKHTLRFLTILGTILSLFTILMLLTETIKDIAYVANRGVSLFYYTISATALLFVSLTLCNSHNKGIFRFCILATIPFAFLFSIIFFAPLTTKSIIWVASQESSEILSPIITGVKSGLFYSADAFLFFLCFREQIQENGHLPNRKLMTGFIFASTFIIIYNMFTSLIFGNLTRDITDPDYALVKLIKGIDMTETVSAVRIISFLIKSSISTLISADFIMVAFPKIKIDKKIIILILYAIIPVSFLALAFFDKTLKYGAFQSFIYPVNAISALCFILAYKLQK